MPRACLTAVPGLYFSRDVLVYFSGIVACLLLCSRERKGDRTGREVEALFLRGLIRLWCEGWNEVWWWWWYGVAGMPLLVLVCSWGWAPATRFRISCSVFRSIQFFEKETGLTAGSINSTEGGFISRRLQLRMMYEQGTRG